MRDKFLNAFEREWSEEELKRACRVLSMAAIRYGMLRQSNDSMVVFDLKRWIDPKGETGIYLLYAYARIQSIKRKTGLQSSSTADWSLLSHEAEISLLSSLVVYPDTITRATDEYAPNHLCGFAYQLCRAFNRFYRDCSIKDAENDSVRLARLSLADVVGLTLKHCLSLLGIEVLEQM